MLGALVVLVLAASCAPQRPTVGLAIAGTEVPASREGSFCQGGACGGACGDGPAPVAPLTVVRSATPVRLDFSAGREVAEIAGHIWQGETLSGPSIESFVLSGPERSHTSTRMATGRYYLAVLVRWSRLFDRGDSARAFLVDISPP
jgi:hypothetical protein